MILALNSRDRSDMSEDVKAFIAAGNASLKAGDRNGAMLAWCRALDLDPHLATAHNNLGAISLMAGEPWLALPCFLNSTRLRPEQGGFRVGLARTLVELGEPERAAACLADAAKRLPDNAAVQEAARQVTADAAMLTWRKSRREIMGGPSWMPHHTFACVNELKVKNPTPEPARGRLV